MAESETNNEKMKRVHVYWLVAVFFVFILPIIVTNLRGIPNWLGRAIAVTSLMFFFAPAIFWYGLNPKTKMVRGGGLAEARFDKIRPRIEIGIRIAVVVFGIFFTVFDVLPLASDLYHVVKGEMPATFTAKVRYRTSGLGGVLLGENSIRFEREGKSYYVFYNWTKPLRVGESYEFRVLPRSRMVLDFHKAEAPPS